MHVDIIAFKLGPFIIFSSFSHRKIWPNFSKTNLKANSEDNCEYKYKPQLQNSFRPHCLDIIISLRNYPKNNKQ